MLQTNQANQSIGIATTAAPATYALLKVQGTFVNPGVGALNAKIVGKFYELIPDAGELDQQGAIGFVLLDGGGNVVGSHVDVVVAAFPVPLNTLIDSWLDRTDAVETGVTPRQFFRLAAAVLGGVSENLGSGNFRFKGANVATNRVLANVPGDGTRPAVTLTL